MSNNMTRKGLAVGAGLGLLATGLVGVAPAQAAETLTLTPTTGTSYKVLTTSDFNLTVGFAGTESAAAVNTVKYLVSNPSGATMAFDVYAAGGNGGTTVDYVPGTTTNAAATATSVVVYDDTTDAIGSRSGLLLSITPVASTSSNVTVQAWLDIDGDNVVDAGEATSPARTVEFVDHASVSATATIDTAVVGAASLSATVSIPGFNMDQLDSDDVKVEFFKNNVTIANTSDTAASASGTGHTAFGGAVSVALRTNPNTAAWSAADAEMRSTLYPDANDATAADNTVYDLVANVATAVYTAKVRLYDGTNWVTVTGSTGSATPASGQVSALAALAELNGSSNTAGQKLRPGSGSFTAYTTATINAGIAKAGQVVTFVISETGANTLATGASITAGGKTLTNSNIGTTQKITVTATTDALGVAYLPISYSGLVKTNTFSVNASALNTTASVAMTGGAVTYTAEASDVFKIVSNVYNGNLQSVIGSAFSVTWTIVDQYGQVPEGTYRLVITENGTANYAQNLSFVNGKATLTQIENATAAASYTMSADVEQQNADLSWDATPTAADGALAGDVAVTVYAADPTVAAISVTASDDGTTTGGNALNLLLDADLFQGHTDLDQNTTAKPTLADNIDNSANATVDYDDGVATLTWTVTSSTGELLVGEPITVSGAGLQFVNGTKVYGIGSISGTTNTSGQFAVKVYSNIAGKHTVSAVAGGVTKTDDLTFRQAADDTASSISVTAPATAVAGSTYTATVTLKDKFGNAVITDSAATGFFDGTTAPTFAITYTGPGLTVGTLPSKTGSAGTASFNVLLGSADTGVITIAATYDADGTATAKTAITASAKVNDAVAAAADTKVNAGSFKGYVAIYAKGHAGKRLSAKVGNDWVVVPALASNFVRVVEYTGAGYTIAVRIYIDRVLVDTITVTTK